MAPTSLGAAKVLASFIESSTLAVVRLDVTRLEPATTVDGFKDLLSDTPAHRQELGEGFLDSDPVAQWRRNYLNARGREVFILLSLVDGEVVPLYIAGGSNPDLAALKHAMEADPFDVQSKDSGVGSGEWRIIRGVVVGGSPSALGRLESASSATQSAATAGRLEEMCIALDSLENLPAAIVVMPSDEMRRTLEVSLPKWPATEDGVPMQTFTQGVRWIAAGVCLARPSRLRLVIDCRDATTAPQVKEAYQRLLAAFTQQPWTRRYVRQLASYSGDFTPTANGGRLVLDLPDARLKEIMPKLLVGPVAYARAQARISISLSSLRSVYTAIGTYKSKHNNAVPPNLQVLVEEGLLEQRLLWGVCSDKPFVYFAVPVSADLDGSTTVSV
jgi:hypothetical protein